MERHEGATGCLAIGAGVAGLLDGIVFHQILRWHHLLTGDRAPVDADCAFNSAWDGWFALACLVLLVGGVVRLARRGVADGRAALGAALVGGGGFDLLEGLIDHQALGLHHVRAGAHRDAYDLAYLAASAALIVLGVGLRRRRRAVA